MHKSVSGRGNSSGIFRAEISATVVAEHVWRAALYTLNVELHDKDSQVLDDWHKQIGLRELTISRNQDEWGEEFCFRVNGVKIFAMGADYIPEDSVVTRVTPEQTLRLLKDCAAANFNTIRVWGGGYYPDDWFYDAAIALA